MSIISGGTSGGGGAVVSIAATTAPATAASLDFSGISQTFNHLRLVANVKGDNPGGAGQLQMRLNGDSTAIYDICNPISIGSAVVTVTAVLAATAARIAGIPGTTTTVQATSLVDLVIPNYSLTTFYKTWSGNGGRKDADGALASLICEAPWGSYRSTTAITAITLLVRGNSGTAQNFLIGSSAFLYGIS